MDDDFKSISRKRKRKNKKSAVITNSFNVTIGRCPICQIPIFKERGRLTHVSSNCEGATEDAEECPEGLGCQEKDVEHFQRFSHFKLALSLSHQESKLIKEDRSCQKLCAELSVHHREQCGKKETSDPETILNSVCNQELKLKEEICHSHDIAASINDDYKDNCNKQEAPDKGLSPKSDSSICFDNIFGQIIYNEKIVTSKVMTVNSGALIVPCDICNSNANNKLSTFNPSVNINYFTEDDKFSEEQPIKLNIMYNNQGFTKISVDFLSEFEVKELQIFLGNCCHFVKLKCIIGKKSVLPQAREKYFKTLAFFDFTSLGLNEYSSADNSLVKEMWHKCHAQNIEVESGYVDMETSLCDMTCDTNLINSSVSSSEIYLDLQDCDTTEVRELKRDDIKEKWKDIFKKRKNNVNDPAAVVMPPPSFGEKSKTWKKSCPFYKRIPGTSFAVDAFQYGVIPAVTHYFLTHFHSDHYGGLTKNFKQRIICSSITAALVAKKLYVEPKYIHVVKERETIFIGNVKITPLDANHCPGSLMFLFQLVTGDCYLHVGDFRANSEMEKYPAFSSINVDILYLDTTYCNPRYVFPTQEEVVSGVVRISLKQIKLEPATLIVSGTYTIGKEKIFMGIANAIKSNIWAPKPKRDVLKCLKYEDLTSRLVESPHMAQVHVWPMGKLNHQELEQHLRDCNRKFKKILAFNPSGWNYQRPCAIEDIPAVTKANVTILSVPYSEHSSYNELRKFVKFLKPKKVIPTVGSRDFTAITQCCNKWLTEPEEKNESEVQQKLTSFFISKNT